MQISLAPLSDWLDNVEFDHLKASFCLISNFDLNIHIQMRLCYVMLIRSPQLSVSLTKRTRKKQGCYQFASCPHWNDFIWMFQLDLVPRETKKLFASSKSHANSLSPLLEANKTIWVAKYHQDKQFHLITTWPDKMNPVPTTWKHEIWSLSAGNSIFMSLKIEGFSPKIFCKKNI